MSLPNANVSTGVTSTATTVGTGTYAANTPIAFTFAAPGTGGTAAQAVATVNAAGAVTAITITNPGSGYVTAPAVFTLPGVSGGTATTVTATIATNTTSYRGGTFFDGGQAANSGTLSLGSNNAIPGTSGTLTLVNGTLSATTALLIPNAVSFSTNASTSTISNVTFSGSSITFTGAVNATTASNNVTLTVNSGNTTTFTGVVGASIAAVTKQGTGTLDAAVLNTFTGNLTIANGIFVTQSAAGVGAGSVIVASGTTLAVQQIGTGALTVARPLTVIGSGFTAGGRSAPSRCWAAAPAPTRSRTRWR